MTLGRTLSPDELVSGFIPPVAKNEARPSKPRPRSRYMKTFNVFTGVYYGDPLRFRTAKTVEIEIPEEAPPSVYRDGINYHDQRPVIAENEFIVPDHELVSFNDSSADKAQKFKDIMYSSAATLSAMDAASDYVGAALNDGLDLGLEMDDRPFAAFVHLSRLEILSAAVNELNISDKQKRLMLGHLTKSLADKAVEAMALLDTGDRQRRIMQAQMHAVVRPQSKQQADELDLGDKRLGHKRARL